MVLIKGEGSVEYVSVRQEAANSLINTRAGMYQQKKTLQCLICLGFSACGFITNYEDVLHFDTLPESISFSTRLLHRRKRNSLKVYSTLE